MKTLYLCYFGLRQPLVQTQVLPYLREIAKDDTEIHLLTFEAEPDFSRDSKEIRQDRKALADEGIHWHFLKYHKRPSAPATIYDVFCGAFRARRIAREHKIDVFHGRVHIPAMMGWLANKMLRRKRKLFFDIRGFFPEEYVDAGLWKEDSLVFGMAKRAEKWLLRDSDAFVVLTEKARDILFPGSRETGRDTLGRPVEVVPCCVDLEKFESLDKASRLKKRKELGITDRFVVAYVGSFGGFYMTEETADFYGLAKKKDASTFALILTQSPPEMIEPLLNERGFSNEDYFIQKVGPDEIPAYLSAADAAISFIKPSYSKLASSPTKNAEYLASGLPMIANSEVGDTEEMIEEDGTGYVINQFSKSEYESAFEHIKEMIADRETTDYACRASAKKRFDLSEIGGSRYRRVYRRLFSKETK
ncbi:MAG: glycosyltransferase [Pyrinomonadaceae bacterium]|nr:glycosyltransferase [Pyrinomonadaceae bacterium]